MISPAFVIGMIMGIVIGTVIALVLINYFDIN